MRRPSLVPRIGPSAGLSLLAASGLVLLSTPAQALPAYARQTGSECAACHIGGYGPQLTAYGRAFKLQGYGSTSSWNKPKDFKALSAMIVGNFTTTARDQSAPPADGFKTNDNAALQEASVFLAGRLAPGLGAFAQVTYSGIDKKTSLDNVDLRYAREFKLGDTDAVAGVSLNNNPTVQDAWNSTPAWSFPYTSPDLAPGRNAAPMIADGLGGQVWGLTPYLWIDNRYYLEIGAYKASSDNLMRTFNIDPEAPVDGLAPYWRVAYSREFKGQSASIGAFGLSARIKPDPLSPKTDRYDDVGIDASYQYIGNRKNIFTLDAALIDERRRFDASFAAGDAAKRDGRMKSFTLDGTWSWRQTFGVTAGVFDTWGSSDALLYAPGADSGSRLGSPDSRGYSLQVDWTPFGKEDSWKAPNANLRLGVQYTGYDRFNGASTNYDGFGRDASDNNTLSVFVWTAF